MSKYRVGLIAEGPTDITVIKSIVCNIFPDKVFVFNSISPSPEEISLQQKDEGFGWGGVYRVCRNLALKLKFAEGISGAFDFVIIHIDADVAYSQYDDIGELNPPIDDLPCAILDDYKATCESLETVVCNWIVVQDGKILTCIPYICTETWVGCWLYQDRWTDIVESTNEETLYKYLYRLGSSKSEKSSRLIRKQGGRIKKCTKGYKNAASNLTTELWNMVTARYTQAKLFDLNLRNIMEGINRST